MWFFCSLFAVLFISTAEGSEECYTMVGSGVRVGGQFVSRRYSEPSLSQCANKCLRVTSRCSAFSYSGSEVLANEVSIELNCELTLASVTEVNDTVLISDADYSTYSVRDLTSCRSVARLNAPMESREYVRYSLRSSSLSRCQQSCMDADFFCTAFSYKTDYDSNEINCELSADSGWENDLAGATMFDTYERERTIPCGYFGAGTLGAGSLGTGAGQESAGGTGSVSTSTSTALGSSAECYRLTGPGHSLEYSEVSRRLAATSLHLCQQACSQATITCRAFSYRRSNFDSDKNCLLSSSGGNAATGVDRDYDTYSRGHGLECAGSGTGPAGEGSDQSAIRCFRLNAPDSRLKLSLIIRNVMTSNVHSCAEECKITTGCKSFSFRRDSTDSQLNCEMSMARVLTGAGPTSSVVNRDQRYDTYSREYGLACRVDPGPVTTDTSPTSTPVHSGCYTLVANSKRLQPYRVDVIFRAVSESQCQHACLQSTSISCRSFSYSFASQQANCALSSGDAYPSRLTPDRGARTFQRDFSRHCHMPNMTSTSNNNDACFSMVVSHSRIVNTRTDQRLQSFNLDECMNNCRAMDCQSLSFKPSEFAGDLNCRLSRTSVSPRDLINDRGHATFIRRNVPACQDTTQTSAPVPGQCFSFIGSGARHQDRFIDGATVAANIQQCQTECARIAQCRTLSFREFGQPNCLLSRRDNFDTNSLLHIVLQSEPSWTVLQKQDNSGQCPPVLPGSPVPFQPPPGPFPPNTPVSNSLTPNLARPSSIRPNSLAPSGSNPSGVILTSSGQNNIIGPWSANANSECYRLLRRNQRLDSRIVQSLQIEQLSQCEQACTDDHRCISFNFRSSSSGSSVCELADSDSHTRLARFSDKSGWNFYEREASSFCSGWDNSFYQQHDYGYAYCSLRVQANLMLNVNAVRRDIIVRNLFECEQACRDELQFRCETFSFGLSLPGNHLSCQLTDRRVSDLSPRDTVARPNFEIYDFHGNGRGCDRSDDQYDYRHGHVFTCSGQQCTRGPCRIDRAGGFWYCFTDADDAVWDYCCDPDSGCHTEARMTMPTCYVTQQRGAYRNAATDTAWRPCTQQPPQRFAFLTRSLHTNTSHTVNSARRVDSDSDTVLSNSVNTATETGPDPRTFTKFTFSPQESNVTLN